ncbi:hypothetical protein KTAU_25060 [Thermogemmatispora aurantia]|uniref:Uncharacterized protein n=1 Tax=Thermogemmatispora aurantia TaxID=2045279 RepID=A0A5J4KAU8_9CHLR|nr:hypothetical protein KTAU_25060 [Thermogemmatispora aurantia]
MSTPLFSNDSLLIQWLHLLRYSELAEIRDSLLSQTSCQEYASNPAVKVARELFSFLFRQSVQALQAGQLDNLPGGEAQQRFVYSADLPLGKERSKRGIQGSAALYHECG